MTSYGEKASTRSVPRSSRRQPPSINSIAAHSIQQSQILMIKIPSFLLFISPTTAKRLARQQSIQQQQQFGEREKSIPWKIVVTSHSQILLIISFSFLIIHSLSLLSTQRNCLIPLPMAQQTNIYRTYPWTINFCQLCKNIDLILQLFRWIYLLTDFGIYNLFENTAASNQWSHFMPIV